MQRLSTDRTPPDTHLKLALFVHLTEGSVRIVCQASCWVMGTQWWRSQTSSRLSHRVGKTANRVWSQRPPPLSAGRDFGCQQLTLIAAIDPYYWSIRCFHNITKISDCADGPGREYLLSTVRPLLIRSPLCPKPRHTIYISDHIIHWNSVKFNLINAKKVRIIFLKTQLQEGHYQQWHK